MTNQTPNSTPISEAVKAPENARTSQGDHTIQAATPDPSGYLAELAAHEELTARLRPANKIALFDRLEAAGISQVIVSFDGYGDSGQIENVEARNAADEVNDLPTTPVVMTSAIWGQAEPEQRTIPVGEAIEWLAYDALRETHGGWENNDGAYGEFIFDVAARSISLDYNERYTATEFFSHEF